MSIYYLAMDRQIICNELHNGQQWEVEEHTTRQLKQQNVKSPPSPSPPFPHSELAKGSKDEKENRELA